MKVDESKAELRKLIPGMSSFWLTRAVLKNQETFDSTCWFIGSSKSSSTYLRPSQISRAELKFPMFQHVMAHRMEDKMMASLLSDDD